MAIETELVPKFIQLNFKPIELQLIVNQLFFESPWLYDSAFHLRGLGRSAPL